VFDLRGILQQSLQVVAGLLLLAPFAALVGWHARRRGYSFWTWWAAATLLNPLFVLVALAVAPHAARLRLRERFARELDEKLANRAATPVPAAGGAVPAVSLGDQATRLPDIHRERSLGDEETRA
jgi:hypothetical protein